jgi:hypothetical protein
MENAGKAGVYFRQDPTMGYLYVGETHDIATRDHGNASHFLYHFIHTADKATAKILEEQITILIKEKGIAKLYKGKSHFKFPAGKKAEDEMMKLIRSDDRMRALMRSMSVSS